MDKDMQRQVSGKAAKEKEGADAPFTEARVHEEERDPREMGELQRQLKSRHIAMISLGGVIGTGLFLGTATALKNGGPLGLWLGYSMMGSIVFAVMVCLAKWSRTFQFLVVILRWQGASYRTTWLSQSAGFTGITGTIVLPAELSAAAVLVNYWNDTINNAVWITIFLVIVIGINMGGARAYGEAEFWFALLKIITIIGLIIMGIVITAGGGPGEAIGFRYWRQGAFQQFHDIPGPTGRFLGFWSVLIQAAFSYIGTEITAIAAGEAKNPKRNLPRAIKKVYFRIIVFYIIGTFVIGLIASPNDPALNLSAGTAAKSPWVTAVIQAGIGGLPSVINAAFLASAWSAASSDLYTSSRALYGLALTGSAPKFLTKTTSWGLPIYAVGVGCAFALLSYMNAGASSAGQVFGWFANMTSVAGLVTWQAIFIIYLRFHKGAKVQGLDRKVDFPYTAPLQPYLSYYGLIFTWLILITNGFSVFLKDSWDTATFITSYLPIVLFFIFFFGHKLILRDKMISYEDMDFHTGSRVGIVEHEDPPRNFAEKIWRAVM